MEISVNLKFHHFTILAISCFISDGMMPMVEEVFKKVYLLDERYIDFDFTWI